MEGDKPATELQPGDICPKSGLYMVVHYEHRLPHKVVVSQGDTFPPCQRCGKAVRFRLVISSGAEAGPQEKSRGAGQDS